MYIYYLYGFISSPSRNIHIHSKVRYVYKEKKTSSGQQWNAPDGFRCGKTKMKVSCSSPIGAIGF